MFKVICTGNPNKATIARAIKQVFPDAEFVHLSVGYDFTTDEGLAKFRETVKNYNVFVNASHFKNGIQSTLLEITRDEWTAGHVINIGSVLEYDHFSWWVPEDADDKKALKKLSIELCNETFKTTHIICGAFKDQKPDAEFKMDPIHIANTIKWIVSATEFHVPVIGIENDYWNKGQEGSAGDWQTLKNEGIRRCNS